MQQTTAPPVPNNPGGGLRDAKEIGILYALTWMRIIVD
jgi:hypothetical protein